MYNRHARGSASLEKSIVILDSINAARARFSLRHVNEPVLTFMSEHLRLGMTVVDIGANAGNFSAFFWRVVGSKGQVYSFEPNPRMYAELASKASGVANWHAYDIALAETSGTRTFHVDAGKNAYTSGFTQIKDNSSAEITVQIETLDNFVAANSITPSFLKIDAEHAEQLIFAGAWKTIGAHHPSILFECHQRDWQGVDVSVCRRLEAMGYSLSTIHSAQRPTWKTFDRWPVIDIACFYKGA